VPPLSTAGARFPTLGADLVTNAASTEATGAVRGLEISRVTVAAAKLPTLVRRRYSCHSIHDL
jgi:hypothetical protein